MNRCCETCRNDLGGGYDNCLINLEAECGAGCFEAWEPKDMGYDMEYTELMIARALASAGITSKDIIGVALSKII